MATFPNDKDAYEKWYRKYLEETNANHEQTEKDYFNKLKSNRELLNNLENIPQPNLPQEPTKISTPVFMIGQEQEGNYPNNLNGPSSLNRPSLYTIEGYPKNHFLKFYEQPNYMNQVNNYQQNVNANVNQMNPHGVIRREANDITNKVLYDKLHNSTYNDYFGKQKEFLYFNKDIATDNLRYKGYLQAEKRRINDERVEEMNRLRRLEQEEKLYENEKKRIYKNLLDDQIKIKIPSKLGPEYYSQNLNENAIKFNNPHLYLSTPENTFMNKNKLVEVNPCNLFY